MLSSPRMRQLLQWRESYLPLTREHSIRDVYDGEAWLKHRDDDVEYPLHVQVFADGANLAQEMKATGVSKRRQSATFFYISILNLPPHERVKRHNCLLVYMLPAGECTSLIQ
jgi:hypothetical protein